MVRIRQGRLRPGGGGKAPYLAIAHIKFPSADAFEKALAKHGAEILGDIPNYTRIEPVMQVNEVVASAGLPREDRRALGRPSASRRPAASSGRRSRVVGVDPRQRWIKALDRALEDPRKSRPEESSMIPKRVTMRFRTQ